MNHTANLAAADKSLLLERRKSLFRRIHFWAALVASPAALIATLTGLLYVFTPQIESMLYGSLDRVTPAGVVRPLDGAVAAAKAAVPAGMKLRFVVPPYDPNDSVKVYFGPSVVKPEHEGHSHGNILSPMLQPMVVSVNPYTGAVLGSEVESARFGNWAKKLHSSLLQGDAWRWMIELAASWLMVMLITGMYLWWPRNNQSVLPTKNARGRGVWKQWHSFLGMLLSLLSLTMIVTGLTWSKYAGGQIRIARDMTGQAPPQAPRNLKSCISCGDHRLTWQAAWDAARRDAPDVSMQLTPPSGRHGVWRAVSADPSQPEKKFEMLFDAYRGNNLYYADWADQTAFSKATAIGIPFHRGEFGWWNQALLLLFGLGILFSLVTGWVMFFKRRREGMSGLPRLLPGAWTAAPPTAWVIAVVLCVFMPLLALSAALVLSIEFLMRAFTRKRVTG